CDPLRERFERRDRLVADRRRRRQRRYRGRLRARRLALAELTQVRAQLQTRVQLAKALAVRLALHERFVVLGQRHIAVERRELARELQVFEAGAQALTDFACNRIRIGNEIVERAVLVQPFRGGLRPDLRYAGDVVGRIADEREIVDDLLRPDVEFLLDALAVQARSRHRVDERDALVDELRHVFIARRDQYVDAVGGRSFRE